MHSIMWQTHATNVLLIIVKEWNSTLAAKAGYLLDCHLPRPSVTRDFAQSGYIYSILARRVTADTVAETAIYSWAGNHVVKRQVTQRHAIPNCYSWV